MHVLGAAGTFEFILLPEFLLNNLEATIIYIEKESPAQLSVDQTAITATTNTQIAIKSFRS